MLMFDEIKVHSLNPKLQDCNCCQALPETNVNTQLTINGGDFKTYLCEDLYYFCCSLNVKGPCRLKHLTLAFQRTGLF